MGKPHGISSVPYGATRRPPKRPPILLLRHTALVLCLCFCCLLGCSAQAVNWSLSPSISVSEQYDSNINFNFRNPEDDFITVLKPVFSVTGDTERTNFRSDSTVKLEKYLDHPDLDDIEYDFNNVVRHKVTERFSVDASAHFARDTTLDTQLEQAGLQTERADRYVFDAGMGQTYALSERVTASLRETAGTTLFPNEEYPDTFLWQIESDVGVALTPRDTLHLNLAVATTEYNYASQKPLPIEASSTRTLQEMVVWERALNETTKLRLGAGFRTTWTDIYKLFMDIDPDFGVRTSKEKATNLDNAPVFLAGLEKAWSERFSTTLTAGEEQYSSPDARSFNRIYGALTLTYRLSEVTTLNTLIRYDHNDTDEVTQEVRDYLRVAPTIERKLSETLSVRLIGVYEKQWRDLSSFTGDADRYQMGFELTYRWPQLLTNQ